MTIGVWDPKSTANLTLEQLRTVLSAVNDIDMSGLTSALDDHFIQDNARLMKLDRSCWQESTNLDTSDIETLVRFFTLAEMQLPGWEGGNRNPVIYLVKILRSRGEFSTELKKWVKANTDNRYLPNGSAL